MTLARKQLLETLVGHFAWLESAHPRKANSPLAKKTRRYARSTLRQWPGRGR